VVATVEVTLSFTGCCCEVALSVYAAVEVTLSVVAPVEVTLSVAACGSRSFSDICGGDYSFSGGCCRSHCITGNEMSCCAKVLQVTAQHNAGQQYSPGHPHCTALDSTAQHRAE
jgi:hypothetical protein